MLPKQIKSLQHPFIKHLVKLRNNKRYRYEKQEIVLSNNIVIDEISSCFSISYLLYATKKVPQIPAQNKIQVTKEIIKKISGIKTAEDMLIVLPLPKQQDLTQKNYLIVLDNIQDPGNVGTIIRSALALGWEGIIFTPTCCDPFNDKVLRAAKGAILKLPFCIASHKQIHDISQKYHKTFLIADIAGKNIDTINTHANISLVLSNEAHGPSSWPKGTQKVTIPMTKNIQSLNVAIAGAILMQKLGPKL